MLARIQSDRQRRRDRQTVITLTALVINSNYIERTRESVCVHYSVGLPAVILSHSSISLRLVNELLERRREESGVMLQRLSCRIMIQLNEGGREEGGEGRARGGETEKEREGKKEQRRRGLEKWVSGCVRCGDAHYPFESHYVTVSVAAA